MSTIKRVMCNRCGAIIPEDKLVEERWYEVVCINRMPPGYTTCPKYPKEMDYYHFCNKCASDVLWVLRFFKISHNHLEAEFYQEYNGNGIHRQRGSIIA